MVDKNEPKKRAFDSETTPIIFSDGIHGMQVRDGMVSFNLTTDVFPVPRSAIEGGYTQAVARLVIPLNAYVRMVQYLQKSLQEFEKENIIQVEEISQEKKADA